MEIPVKQMCFQNFTNGIVVNECDINIIINSGKYYSLIKYDTPDISTYYKSSQ